MTIIVGQKWTAERTAELARDFGFERTAVRGRYQWRLACSYCDQWVDFDYGPTISITEVLLPASVREGWLITKFSRSTPNYVHCPSCRKNRGATSMRHSKFASLDEVVRELQDYGVRPGQRGGTMCWDVECACGSPQQVGREYIPDLRTWVNTALKSFRRIGWAVEFGRPPRCPRCAREDRGEPPYPRRDDRPVTFETRGHVFEGEAHAPLALPAPSAAPTTAIGAALVAAALKIAPAPSSVTAIGTPTPAWRLVHKLLSKHFDEDRGLFEPGWDDARVAAESETQPAFVESIRREYFKELAEAPEVTALRRQYEAFEARHDAERQAFEARHNEERQALAAMKEQLDNLKAPLKRKRLTEDEEARAMAKRMLDEIQQGRIN